MYVVVWPGISSLNGKSNHFGRKIAYILTSRVIIHYGICPSVYLMSDCPNECLYHAAVIG